MAAPAAGSLLSSCKIVAFAATRDPDRAKAFYEDTLGLPLLSDDRPFALVFNAHGTMLRVTVVREMAPAPYTVLGWDVLDIAVAVRMLEAAGVKFERFDGVSQDELGIWRSPSGARVAWFKDPDGNVLSITQF